MITFYSRILMKI